MPELYAEAGYRRSLQARSLTSTRIGEWTRSIAVVGSGTIIIQALAFVGGIIIIRILPTEQYALYTLTYAMLGTLSVLGDGGLSGAMMAEAGKVWQDRRKLGVVMVTARRLRWILAGPIVLIAPVILLLLLRKHGAGLTDAALLSTGAMALFLLGMNSTIYSIPLRLHQRNLDAQRVGVVQSIGRLAALLPILAALPIAAVALLTTAAAQLLANHRLQAMSNKLADPDQEPEKASKDAMTRVMLRVFPGAAYCGVSGQLTVWLVSVSGSTSAIADIGALSRIGQVHLLLSGVLIAFAGPRFARMKFDRELLSRRFLQALGLSALLGAAPVILSLIFPNYITAILGNEYQHLGSELVLMMTASGLTMLSGTAFSLAVNRGWVLPPAISVPILLTTQVILVINLNIGTVSGVLWLTILTAAVSLVMYAVHALHTIRKQETVENTQ